MTVRIISATDTSLLLLNQLCGVLGTEGSDVHLTSHYIRLISYFGAAPSGQELLAL